MYTAIANITQHQDTVNCLGFSDDGVFLASGDDSGLLVISRTEDPKKYDKYHLADSITCLVWIPGSQSLYVGLANCDVNLIFLEEERAYRLKFHPPGYDDMAQDLKSITQVNCLSFDPYHSRLAVGVGSMMVVASIPDLRSNKYNEECVIIPEDRASKKNSMLLKSLPAEVRSVHFIEEGQQIVVTYLEEGIRCYGIHDRKEMWRIVPKSYRIGRSTLDSQMRFIVCSNLYNGFNVYSIRKKAYHRTFIHETSEENNVILPILFIHDDDDVLLGSAFGQVTVRSIWGDGSTTLDHGDDMIQAIAFTDALKSGCYIATACAEKGLETYIRLWLQMDEEGTIPSILRRTLSSLIYIQQCASQY
ncbi:hypothetical protein H1R20_g15419, partial [Candolleomyces eurysporus]